MVTATKSDRSALLGYRFSDGTEVTFAEESATAFCTPNRGLRSRFFEALICRGRERARIMLNGDYLDGAAISELRKRLGVCRTPPSWMPRDSILDSFKLVFKVRGLPIDAELITSSLEQVNYFDWPSRPRLDSYPEYLNDNYSRALALTRLLMLPCKAYILDNPLHGQEGERRELLLSIIGMIYDRPGIKILLADKPENFPSFMRERKRIRERDNGGIEIDG